MKKVSLFLLFLFSPCLAFGNQDVVYFFGKLSVVFTKVEDVYVNKTCANKKCEAFKSYIKFKDQEIDSSLLEGGKNPRSVRCTKIMDGQVLIGKDIEGNQQSVCKFKDDSFLI